MNGLQQKLVAVAFVFLALTSAWYSFRFVSFVRTIDNEALRLLSRDEELQHYSFEGEDVPLAMKTDAEFVRMIVEESVRYDQANPEGSREWRYTAHPLGSGVVHLGPRHRSLFVNMFHQLHCIEYFAENLVRTHDGERAHLQHCLNFMRIMTLCRPDLTLEPGDFSRRNFTSERTGAEHVCRDWTPAYDKATESYLAWGKMRDEQTSRQGDD